MKHRHERRGGGLRLKVNAQRGKRICKSYPEDEIEDEKQIFDAFSAAFDSHDERLWRGAWRTGTTGARATK